MERSLYTVENLILGTDNLDEMVREIRLVVGILMRFVREEARSHDGWSWYQVSRKIGPWTIVPEDIGEVRLDHRDATCICEIDGEFRQPSMFLVAQVRGDLQILMDQVINDHPTFANRIEPIIAAAVTK